MISFWERETFTRYIDAAIIGSGIVGLNAALRLKALRPRWRIVVLERGVIPSGASTRNAGFACFGSLSELVADLRHHSESEVFGLVEARWRGLQLLRELIGDDRLGYENYGGYELFLEQDADRFRDCKDHLYDINRHMERIIGEYGIYRFADAKKHSFGFQQVKHLVYNPAESQINTGMMMKSLLALVREQGIEVWNGMEIRELVNGNPVKLKGLSGVELEAERVLIATNGFARMLMPELPVEPARAQVLITEPLDELPFRGTFHYEEGYYYFRNVGDRILLGGGRNLDLKGEMTFEQGHTEVIQNKLNEMLKEVILPGRKFSIDMRWSGIMGVGEKKTVIMKNLAENVMCAVRLGGMGVAIGTGIGMQAGEKLSETGA